LGGPVSPEPSQETVVIAGLGGTELGRVSTITRTPAAMATRTDATSHRKPFITQNDRAHP
jgi:hypothetical protein